MVSNIVISSFPTVRQTDTLRQSLQHSLVSFHLFHRACKFIIFFPHTRQMGKEKWLLPIFGDTITRHFFRPCLWCRFAQCQNWRWDTWCGQTAGHRRDMGLPFVHRCQRIWWKHHPFLLLRAASPHFQQNRLDAFRCQHGAYRQWRVTSTHICEISMLTTTKKDMFITWNRHRIGAAWFGQTGSISHFFQKKILLSNTNSQ